MQWTFEATIAIRDFLETGGPVLLFITGTIFVMWVLILERVLYFRTENKRQRQALFERWEARTERQSWYAHCVRDGFISQFRVASNASIPMIKTLVALCPLLGLMGTVTGMIEVFDVLAVSGTGNARSMAAGVAKATIPTMAGMVGALSGVFAGSILSRAADREVERLDESLLLDH